MFITLKRHEREKKVLADHSNRLTEAVLKSTDHGLFLIDAKDKILPPVSPSLATLFRRHDFSNLTLQKLLSPLVTAKTLSLVRNHFASLLSGAAHAAHPVANPLRDIDLRLANSNGSFDTVHYSFDFDSIVIPNEPRLWMVRVTDLTLRLQTTRELEDLRSQIQIQGEILRGVLQMGAARLSAFLQHTDASLKTIASVLKKPAREQDAFRHKLEEILEEVDRIRREAAVFKLSELENTARTFEDSLQELRSRSTLSGSDFLPLAVTLDQLYSQFALVRSMTAAGPVRTPGSAQSGPQMTNNGTQIIEAPKFITPAEEPKSVAGAHHTARAGSLDSTLHALTDHVAQEHNKSVVLETIGLQLIPAKYQAAIKNVAIQLIRNAVMHGIEAPAVREASGKLIRGTLRLEFRLRDRNYELLFEDDGCGIVPDVVRATAIERGLVTPEAAARMRDRETIKLIFKSRFTTLAIAPSDTTHGTGMSLVRRYVHEAGGKIALASLPGHETRFKVTLPSVATAGASDTNESPAAVEAPTAVPAVGVDHGVAAEGATDAAGTPDAEDAAGAAAVQAQVA